MKTKRNFFVLFFMNVSVDFIYSTKVIWKIFQILEEKKSNLVIFVFISWSIKKKRKKKCLHTFEEEDIWLIHSTNAALYSEWGFEMNSCNLQLCILCTSVCTYTTHNIYAYTYTHTSKYICVYVGVYLKLTEAYIYR